MRNVCESCKYAKPRVGASYSIYCVKYGIVRYQPRDFCVAWERTEKIRDGGKDEDQQSALPV